MAGRLWIGAANASALDRRSASLFCSLLGANQVKSYQEVTHRKMMVKRTVKKMMMVKMMIVVMMQLALKKMMLMVLLVANSKLLSRYASSCSYS